MFLHCSFRNSGVPCFAFQWTFSYIGFPVELNTLYFIGAHNIPNANMNEDSPSMSVNFTSPGKLPHSAVILCLAGPFALGYVVGTEKPGQPGHGIWPCWFPHLEYGHNSHCTSLTEWKKGQVGKSPFLCGRPCAGHLTCIISLKPPSTLRLG